MTKQNPQTLLNWYDTHRRDLPWRAKPGDVVDPYRVWLSEIMLQQTTVPTVKAYFKKFVSLWPTVHDLAAAPDEDIMAAWAGLGYYSRARNLIKCARIIVDDYNGQFPDNIEALKSLPGIGDYTANALRAIAFDQSAVVVDGNIERVISRLYRIKTPMPKAKKEIKAKATDIIPVTRHSDYAQSMMDLGAMICTPRNPKCTICPWNDVCAAYQHGDMERYPIKAPKKKRPIRHTYAYVTLTGDGANIYLTWRPKEGLLGGMLQVPTTDWITDKPKNHPKPPFDLGDAKVKKLSGDVRHVFSHFELRTIVHNVCLASDHAIPSSDLYSVKDLDYLALPTLMQKIIRYALASRE